MLPSYFTFFFPCKEIVKLGIEMARRLFQKRTIYACLSYKIRKEIKLIAHGENIDAYHAQTKKSLETKFNKLF